MTRVFKKLASVLVLSAFASLPAAADTAHIAVAANFAMPMKVLAARFEQATGHTLTLSSGSTGKFYAQIKNGAPFDVLLAADDDTPARLQREGDAVATRNYAIGKLALWSANANLIDGTDAVLKQNRFGRLAVANPKPAPYGAAAKEVLGKLDSSMLSQANSWWARTSAKPISLPPAAMPTSALWPCPRSCRTAS